MTLRLLTLSILSLLFQSTINAQNQKVEYITLSELRHDTVTLNLDTMSVYYSNSRSGIAVPRPQPTGLAVYYDFTSQPIFYDSIIRKGILFGHGTFYRKYDVNNNIIQDRFNDGPISARYDYVYSNNNQLLSKTKYSISGSTVTPISKDSFTYDNNGNIMLELKCLNYPKQNAPNWIIIDSIVYTYNSNNLISVRNYTNSQPSATQAPMIIHNHTDNYYTGPVLDSSYKYMDYNSKPEKTKLYYTYSGNKIAVLEKHYSSDTIKYSYSKNRTLYSYNNNNEIAEKKMMLYDTANSVWTNLFEKKVYVYNTLNDIDTVTTYSWNKSSNSYQNYYRTVYYYNKQNNFVSESRLFWNNNQWTSTGLKQGIDTSYVYHYEPLPTSIKNVRIINDVNIYPNPANGILNIDMPTDKYQEIRISVFNIMGTLIKQTFLDNTTTSKKQIPVSSLPVGQYILYLKADNGDEYYSKFAVTK